MVQAKSSKCQFTHYSSLANDYFILNFETDPKHCIKCFTQHAAASDYCLADLCSEDYSMLEWVPMGRQTKEPLRIVRDIFFTGEMPFL